MTHSSNDSNIDPILKAVIDEKAKRMVGQAGLTESDIADIEQHVYAKLVRRFSVGKKDSPRGALLETIVDNALGNFIRDRQAKKRDPKRIISLSIIVDFLDDDGPVELSETITERERDARYGRRRRTDEEIFELEHDEAVARAKLSGEDQEIWDRLKYSSVARVARDLGIPRTTLIDRISRWRRISEVESLAKYL